MTKQPHKWLYLLIMVVGVLLITLNTPTYAQQQDPDDDPNVRVHVVQRGENLFRIALSYGLTTDVVAAANGITDPGNILVGQRLLIPVNGLPQANQQEQIHRVKPGETLRSIANAYETTVDALVDANDIVNPNDIAVGQELTITTGTQTPATASPTSAPTALNTIHVVQSGESLFTIAQRYGTTVEALQQANELADPTRILAGQELRVPGADPQQPTRNLPEAIADLTLEPLTLTEGRTGVLRLTTGSPGEVSGRFLGEDIRFITQDRVEHLAFIAVPIFTETGVYPIDLSVSLESGRSTAIAFNVQVTAGQYGLQNVTLPADRAGLASSGVEENEMNILKNVTGQFTEERYFENSLSLPAAAAMNAAFGIRRSYNGGALTGYHTGADFAGGPGTPVYAAASGQVVLADTLNIRGVSVVIDHGWGVFTNYSHLSERYVQIGDFVNTGQVIGTVGSSGRATGAHLHWELWVNNTPVDPMQWVRQTFP